MPLLRNPDKSKLSKRKNPTSILFYQRMGYLPEALVNYLGRMGWSMPDESEKFTLAQMQDAFDINRVSLGGPVFDVEKLSWLNGQWLREQSDEQFLDTLLDWAYNRDYAMKIIPHLRQRVETLSDVADKAAREAGAGAGNGDKGRKQEVLDLHVQGIGNGLGIRKQTVTVPVIARLVGPQQVLEPHFHVLEVLGGVSKKQMKKLEKAYRDLPVG